MGKQTHHPPERCIPSIIYEGTINLETKKSYNIERAETDLNFFTYYPDPTWFRVKIVVFELFDPLPLVQPPSSVLLLASRALSHGLSLPPPQAHRFLSSWVCLWPCLLSTVG